MEMKAKGESKKFLTVLADGEFHQTVDAATPGAVTRVYEDKAGVMQTKTELVFEEVTGKITNLEFVDGDFGQSIHIELDGEGIISLGTSSNYGEDFMKKLPNIDLSKVARFVPYAFEDGGKTKKGMTIYQDDVKIGSAYYDSESKKSTNGIPEVDGDTSKFRSDDWKMHFMVVRKFLVGKVQALIDEKFPGNAANPTTTSSNAF